MLILIKLMMATKKIKNTVCRTSSRTAAQLMCNDEKDDYDD